jgi:hypothetical protein
MTSSYSFPTWRETTDETYSHCPRSMKFSNLWDVDEISLNSAKPPLPPKESGI